MRQCGGHCHGKHIVVICSILRWLCWSHLPSQASQVSFHASRLQRALTLGTAYMHALRLFPGVPPRHRVSPNLTDLITGPVQSVAVLPLAKRQCTNDRRCREAPRVMAAVAAPPAPARTPASTGSVPSPPLFCQPISHCGMSQPVKRHDTRRGTQHARASCPAQLYCVHVLLLAPASPAQVVARPVGHTKSGRNR